MLFIPVLCRPVSKALSNASRRYRSLPTLKRELAAFGMALLFALTILPVGIWCAGRIFLGDYLRDPGDPALARHGGPLALIGDYLHGIVTFSPGYWLVLLGPYLLFLALRIGLRFTKS
ncbi:MAG: hypothetical protein WDO12_12725 [Pseudomonadota bacterium]